MEKITCTVKEALAASGLGKTKMFELIAAGRVETVKVGTRRLVRMDSLRELLTNVCTNVSDADAGEPRGTGENDAEFYSKEIQRITNRSELERTRK